MSEVDREKWNTRYREGAYAGRDHPGDFLASWLPQLSLLTDRPRAVDLACGAGRNSVYLARHGWQVDAVDISEVALQQVAAKAVAEDLPIQCLRQDLELDLPKAAEFLAPDTYDLAIMFRYTNPPLIGPLSRALRPGGYLIVESHMVTDQDVVGPSGDRHRVAPGELRQAAAGLEIVDYHERLVLDPDGCSAALAQLVARKPSR